MTRLSELPRRREIRGPKILNPAKALDPNPGKLTHDPAILDIGHDLAASATIRQGGSTPAGQFIGNIIDQASR